MLSIISWNIHQVIEDDTTFLLRVVSGILPAIFYANFLLDHFLEHSLTSQATSSRLGSSFLSDLYCSHSKVKPDANIKSVAAQQKQRKGTDSRLVSAAG